MEWVQGSILGPVLFLLFTNDLTQHLPGTKIIMYADDTQFFDFDSPKNTDELKARVENTLSTALLWFTQNRLKINPNKTEMVIFQSKRIRDNPNFSISFDTETIYPSKSAKLLGVFLDCHLSWHDHISFVVRKCYSILVRLARTHRRFPKCTKKTPYRGPSVPSHSLLLGCLGRVRGRRTPSGPKGHQFWSPHCHWDRTSRPHFTGPGRARLANRRGNGHEL